MAKNKENTSADKEKDTEKSVALTKDKDTAEKSKGKSASEKKDKKEKKSAKKEPNKIVKWFKDLRIEFKKVVWPTKQTVINNTAVVLAVVAGSAIIVGALDFGFLHLLSFIYELGK
jgi:preprotein translocase subunit SecE